MANNFLLGIAGHHQTLISQIGPSPYGKVSEITVAPGEVMYRAVHGRPFSIMLKNGFYTKRTKWVLGPLRADKYHALFDKSRFSNAYSAAFSVKEAQQLLWNALRSMMPVSPNPMIASEIELDEASQDFAPIRRTSRAVIRVNRGPVSSILRGPWRDSRTTATKDMDNCVQQFLASGYPAAAQVLAEAHHHQSMLPPPAAPPNRLATPNRLAAPSRQAPPPPQNNQAQHRRSGRQGPYTSNTDR